MSTAALPGISARCLGICSRAFRLFITCMFMRSSLHHGDVNKVISDIECACEGRYGCTRGLIWVHVKADVGSCEWAVMVWNHEQYLAG